MTGIKYVRGSATDPQGDGNLIIAHITNNRGGWGRGFVQAITKVSILPEKAYRAEPKARELGFVQMVRIRPLLYVANMCAQQAYVTRARPVAVDYDALGICLDQLMRYATDLDASVHCPRIGTGLGGGRWEVIQALLTQRLVANGIQVTVYDLPEPVLAVTA